MKYTHNIILNYKHKFINIIDSFLYLHQNKQYDDHHPIALCFSGC